MGARRKRKTGGPSFVEAMESLASRRVVMIGGKGGVGKTTVSAAAALIFGATRPTILFTTDPASNLADLFGTGRVENLTIEALDASSLYSKFLERNLESFLELGDRGTYLAREELRRFFELSLPGIDELMAWSRIGELAEEHPESIVVVDTAPTGHTLRMLSSGGHFRELSAALDAMQEKHRVMVEQLTRRRSRDSIDAFIENFEREAARRRELLADASRAAFVPVMLSEPWVVEQTSRLAAEVRDDGIHIPFVVLNRAVIDPDCKRDRELKARDDAARAASGPLTVVDAPRSCVPLDTIEHIRAWTAGVTAGSRRDAKGRKDAGGHPRPGKTPAVSLRHLTFFAGKGGVGKTTCSASVALQLASKHPDEKVVILSVDPAHALRDVFATVAAPPNLAVEIIDTRARWRQFRDTIGTEIGRAVDAVTPKGMTVAYDAEAMRKLIEIAPPGADEIFAVVRLTELIDDASISHVVVDTAPTGHFLRLLELPQTAGEWVREFMRILLHYRELIPPGSLGEELIRASRALKSLDEELRSERASVIVVTRPERVVIAETERLIVELERRGIAIGAVIANYVTPENDCACDRHMRASEQNVLRALRRDVVSIERRDAPVITSGGLMELVPLLF